MKPRKIKRFIKINSLSQVKKSFDKMISVLKLILITNIKMGLQKF